MTKTSGFQLPPWARRPQLHQCALEIYKNGKLVDVIKDISRKKCTIFGRNKPMCDVTLEHPSISRQHGAILHGASGNIYIVDLGSSHGTTCNHKKLKKKKRHVLADGDIIRFGASSREYHIRHRLEISSSEEDVITRKRKKRKRTAAREIVKEEEGVKKTKKKKSVEGKQVSCRHLLVKHKDSRRPFSWKSEEITRSSDQAVEIAEGFLKKLLASDNVEEAFIELAKVESDCNSNKRGGNLGKFGRGKMQKPFEEAAFSLEIGELSKPVITLSGIHLIYRTG
jgi:NIMA-interacting peptidyl-prolyl cis-trans isomerase 1